MSGIPLRDLTYEHFEKHLNERFEGTHEIGRFIFELVQAKKVGSAPPGRREPFSVLFRGPQEPALPQGTYALDHPALGPVDVFLVPVGPDEHGPCYEMIFT